MRTQNYLIAYDISNEKRLAKVAKILEKFAFRIQNSVFFLPQATLKEKNQLKTLLEKVIKQDEDNVRIYKVDTEKSLALFSGIDLKHINIFY